MELVRLNDLYWLLHKSFQNDFNIIAPHTLRNLFSCPRKPSLCPCLALLYSYLVCLLCLPSLAHPTPHLSIQFWGAFSVPNLLLPQDIGPCCSLCQKHFPQIVTDFPFSLYLDLCSMLSLQREILKWPPFILSISLRHIIFFDSSDHHMHFYCLFVVCLPLLAWHIHKVILGLSRAVLHIVGAKKIFIKSI